MKRKGDLIFWGISDFEVSKDDLLKLLDKYGYAEYLPKNDYRAALLRAIRLFSKGRKLYRKFNDTPFNVKFGVFTQSTTSDDVNLDKEIVFELDKITGMLHLMSKRKHPLFDLISNEYKRTIKTIDSAQFRAVILRVVREKAYGIAMRRNGGIYFIDEKFDQHRTNLADLFKEYPGNLSFQSIPIYDDAGTKDALEIATSEDIFDDIQAIIEDLQSKAEGKEEITKRFLDGRRTEADTVLNKIRIHEKNLRKQSIDVRKRLKAVTETLSKVASEVEAGIFDPSDFYEEIEKLVK